MVLHVELKEEQEKAVRDLARQRGVAVEEIAHEAILAYTSKVDDETFRRHAKESIRDNDELLRRLA